MISGFHGRYRFLSNFYETPVLFDDETYQSVEHAYQAAKTLSKIERRWINSAGSAQEAKRRGRQVNLRQDWHEVKVDIMEKLLRIKFSDPELKRLLLATDTHALIEENSWGDTFWGACDGVGENKLGEILMKIRRG